VNHRNFPTIILALAALACGILLGPASANAGAAQTSSPTARTAVGKAGVSPRAAVVRAVPRAPQAGRRFRSLADAVAAGKLDASVADTLERNGSADALVAFEYKSILLDVLVRGNRSDAAAALPDEFAEQQEEAFAGIGRGLRVLRDFDHLPVAYVRFHSTEALLDVLAGPGVTRVHENEYVQAAAQQSLALIRQPEAVARGHRGTGTIVAVLDTGIEYSRAAFGSCRAPGAGCRVAWAKEYGDADRRLDDGATKHGTNVAGVVAAVAPGARLLSMDVFQWSTVVVNGVSKRKHGASWVSISAALNDAVRLKSQGMNIVAANISIGRYDSWNNGPCSTHYLAGIFQTARTSGILPVVAAGNDAYGSDGKQPFQKGIAEPACVPGALSVGAVADSAHGATRNCGAARAPDEVTSFSQSGDNLSLLAPGNCIVAAGIEMQGTSQAAPHVAGAAAVLAAAKFGSTRLARSGMEQIESALVQSGPNVYDSRSGVTKKRLDVATALATLVSAGPRPTPGRDVTGPAVSGPTEQFELDAQMSSTAATVRLAWSAVDPSGIASYELWVSTNGGAWVRDGSVAPSATAARYALTIGSTYRFLVRARDGAGNATDQAGAPFTVQVADETIFPTLGGGWSRYAWGESFGGTSIASSTAGDWVQVSFTGRDVALVAHKFPNGGRARILCDGSYVGIADLYSATLVPRSQVAWCHWPASGAHTMKVELEGTSGRPRFDVDAFAVLR
jgi:hypothetical protein